MKINIEIDAAWQDDLDAAQRVIDALRGNNWPQVEPTHPSTGYKPEPVEAPTTEPEKPKRTRKPKPDQTSVEVDGVKVAEATHVDAPESEVDDTPMALAPEEDMVAAAEASTELTLKDMQAHGQALITSSPDGRGKLKAVLAEYDAKRLSDIAPEAYAQVADRMKAAM